MAFEAIVWDNIEDKERGLRSAKTAGLSYWVISTPLTAAGTSVKPTGCSPASTKLRS